MHLEINKHDLVELVERQLQNLFSYNQTLEGYLLRAGVDRAVRACEYCFQHMGTRYYKREGVVYFNPFHSGQYCTFLYFLSREVYQIAGPVILADRIYYLNKALNGVDLFYEVELPKIFLLDHPVGSVMGRADYGDYFQFSQNCTVGNNHSSYPKLGERVTMMSGAKVVGASVVGNDVVLSANCYVKDAHIPNKTLVFGSSPDLILKPKQGD